MVYCELSGLVTARPLNAEKSHERSRVILGLVSRREVLFETRIEKIVQKLKYFIKTQGKIQKET